MSKNYSAISSPKKLNRILVLNGYSLWHNNPNIDQTVYSEIRDKTLGKLLEVADFVDEASHKHNAYCMFNEYVRLNHENTLFWFVGAPQNLFLKFVSQNEYTFIRKNTPEHNFWKIYEIDPNIKELLLSKNTDKYLQLEDDSNLPDRYDLFLLQLVNGKDKEQSFKVLDFIKKQKIPTLLKRHPLHRKELFEEFWKEAQGFGILSEYAIPIFGDTNKLIKNATRVYSVDSAASFNALLHNVPVYTFEKMFFSEIVPTCNLYSMDEIPQPSQEDILKYLSWYYHSFVIDTESDNWKDRIEQRIVNFKNKVPLHDLYR